METLKTIIIGILIAIIVFLLVKPSEKEIIKMPIKNYFQNYKNDTKMLNDSIEMLNERVSILKNQRSKTKTTNYRELKNESETHDTIHKPIIKNLLDEVSKRDTLIDVDSLIKMNQEKEIFNYSKEIAICNLTLDSCQNDLIETNKQLVKSDNKIESKKKMVKVLTIIAIVEAIAVFIILL